MEFPFEAADGADTVADKPEFGADRLDLAFLQSEFELEASFDF